MHFGHQLPDLIDEAKKGKGPIGKLVFRLHLQKYLSGELVEVRPRRSPRCSSRPPRSRWVRPPLSTLIALATIAVLTFFTMLEAPRMWQGFLEPVPASRRPTGCGRVVDETIRSVTGYMLGNFLTSVIAGVVVFISLDHPRASPSPGCWASSWPWSTCSPWSAGCWPACRW